MKSLGGLVRSFVSRPPIKNQYKIYQSDIIAIDDSYVCVSVCHDFTYRRLPSSSCGGLGGPSDAYRGNLAASSYKPMDMERE